MKQLKLIALVIAFLLTGIAANSQNITCGIPIGLKNGTITQTTAVISWNKVVGAESYSVNYGISSTSLKYVAVKDTFLLITGLTAGTNYYWEVQSFCPVPGTTTLVESGYSKFFYFITLSPPPTCPTATELTTTNITQTSAALTWSKVTGACGFTVMYYPANAPTSYKTITATSNTANLTGLTASTAYQWKVKTICCPPAGGTTNTYSELSTAQTFTTLAPPPCNPPVNLTYSDLTSTSIILKWDAVTNAYTYIVEYWDTSTINNHFTTTVTTNSATITGLRPGIYYFWKVRTYCGSGVQSDFSQTFNFTTPQTSVCNAPATVETSGITQNSATFSWSKVDGACSYKGSYFIVNNSTSSVPFTTTATSFTATGLTSATSYRWLVQTVCCTGSTSTNYTAQNFVTLPAPTCNAPTEFGSIDITQTSATIKWNPITNACGYYVVVSGLNFIQTIPNATTNTLTLTNLTPNTTYEWKVKTVCCSPAGGQTTYSDFGPLQHFTTLAPPAPCNSPRIAVAIKITQTSATLTWSKVDGACSYNYYITPYNGKLTNTKDTSVTITDLKPGTGYYWMVQTVCCSGATSTTYTTQQFTTLQPPACNAPATTETSAITETSATYNWSKADGACSYAGLYYPMDNSTTSAVSFTTTATNFTATGLKPLTSYHWIVKTVCCNGNTSSAYNGNYFTTKGTPPSCNAPAKVETSAITQTSATFSWSGVDGACSYKGYYSPLNGTTIAYPFTTTATSFTAVNLQPSMSYKWIVMSVCCTGNVSTAYNGQTFVTLTPPVCNAPSAYKYADLTATGVILKWNKVSGACGYNITYFAYATPNLTKTITVKDTLVKIDGLTPGTYYHWQVQTVCCDGGLSVYGPYQIFTTPQLPSCNSPKTAKTITITQTSATLTWSKVEGACSYNYYITPYNGKLTNTKDTSVTLTDLKPATNYTWVVQTICCSGNTSSMNSAQTFTTLPAQTCGAPIQVQTTRITETSATFTWSVVDGACSYAGLYYPMDNSTSAAIPFTTTATSFTASNLKPLTSYHWIVKTVCCSGLTSTAYNGQNFVTLGTPPPVCNAPAYIKAVETGQTAVKLVWNKVTGACSYTLSYNIPGVTNYITVTTQDTSIVINNLLANTAYHLYIHTICCNGGQSSTYADITFTTLPVPPQVCEAPSSLYTINITQTGAVLTWNKVTNACSYYIVYYPTNNTTAYKIIEVKDTTASLFAVPLTNLLPNTEYQWKVRTICCTTAGTPYNYSDFGPVQTFKTLAPPPIACPVPLNLKSSDITSYNATLTWDAVPGAVSYRVAYWSSGNATTPIIVNVYENKLALTGLTPYTKYEWKVRTVCSYPGSTEILSDWSAVSGFMTLPVVQPVCKVPQGLVTKEITQASARLSWNKVEMSCGYIVVWFTSNNTAFKTIETKDTSVVIDGLLADTYYIWKVQTVCCDPTINWKSLSDFSPVTYFKTLSIPVLPCNAPNTFKTTEISQNSAVITWSPVEGSCGYTVVYYPYNDPTLYVTINTKEPKAILAGLNPNTYYQWKVKTICCSSANPNYSYSDFGPVQSFKTLPAEVLLCKMPVNPMTVNITQTSAVAKWSKVPNACSYTLIYYPVNSTTAYIIIQTKDTAAALNNLIPNTDYQWKVKTICCVSGTTQQSESDFIPVQSFKTLVAPQPDCKAPIELSSNDITQTSVVLKWNKVSNAGTYLIEYWQTGFANTPSFAKTQDTIFKLNGLLPGTKYEWEVKSYCITSATGSMISSEWSMVVNFTTLPVTTNTCGAPKILSAERITPNSALLRWNKVPGATSYVIEYFPKNALTVIIMAYTKDTVLSIANLQPNTEYGWKVKTVCCGPTSTTPCFESEFSLQQNFKTLPLPDVKCLAPFKPIAVNITQNSATLKWNKVPNACYYYVYYTSEITMQPGYLMITTKDTSVVLSNLISNMKYDWKVKTICCSSAGTVLESDFTPLQFFTTLPPSPPVCTPPTELASGNITSTSATLKWMPSNAACYYLIVYYPVGGSADMVKYVKSTVPYINISGLTPNTKYEWKVKSYCCTSSGSIVGESDFSPIQAFVTLPGQEISCKTPLHTAVNDITQTSAILRWDSVPNACVYLVAIYDANSATSVIRYIKTLVPYVKVDGLKANTYYTWKVKTYCCSPVANSMSESPYSPLVTFKTLPSTEIKCLPPRVYKTSEIQAFFAKLNWNGDKNAAGYLVYLWADTLTVKSWTTKDTTVTVQGLKAATVYHWKVKSICYSSTAALSNLSPFGPVQTFTTLAVPQVPCVPPTELASGDIKAHNATVGWKAVNNAKYYLIYYKPVNSTNTFKYITTPNPKYMLSGLMANTEYMWKVKSICSVSSINAYKFSDFSPAAFFKTLVDEAIVDCKPPVNLVTSDIRDSSAILGWDAVKNAKVYAVLYQEAKSNVLKYKTTALPIYTLMDLKPLTKYIWRVGALCNVSSMYTFGTFSDTVSFVTNITGKKITDKPVAVDNNLDVSVYPNPTEGNVKISIMNSSAQTQLYIYNIAGQSMYNESINTSSVVINKDVDMTSYPKGIYFVKVSNDNSIVTKKIVVH